VAPVGMIRDDELPPGCGLMEYRNVRLHTMCRATFRDRTSPEWRFVASLCRRIMQAQDLPGYVGLSVNDLEGLNMDECNFFARTIADARSQEVAAVMTNEQAASVLDRVSALLRNGNNGKR
jgi:hypothetical protein